MKSILKMCKKYGFTPKIYTMTTGAEAVQLIFDVTDRLGNYEFSEALTAAYHIRTNPHIEYNPYCGSIRIIPAEAWKELQKISAAQSELLDVFWQARHDGKTAEEAKQLQYNYAVEHNYIAVYNRIYA